jgi:hypothetical protein
MNVIIVVYFIHQNNYSHHIAFAKKGSNILKDSFNNNIFTQFAITFLHKMSFFSGSLIVDV